MGESDCEVSISATMTCIESTLQQLDASGDYTIYSSEEVLSRPPFLYIHELVKFIDKTKPSLGWKKLLLNDDILVSYTRKEKVRRMIVTSQQSYRIIYIPNKLIKLSFMVRLLAIVSKLSRFRYDIFISPSHVLCGKDVLSTHQFLRALAASSLSRPDEMKKIVDCVLEEDDARIYKRAVRTRASIKRFQALFRGWLMRKQCKWEQNENSDCVQTLQQNSVDSSNDSQSTSNDPEKAKIKAQIAIDQLAQSYHEIISRKSQAEDDLKATQEKIRTENDKLARILNIASKHKKQSQPRMPVIAVPLLRTRPPYSAPNAKSARIARILSNKQMPNHLPPIDETFVERITNLAITERAAKRKAKKQEDREQFLKQQLLRSKQKEAELKLQEQRITDLADKIRRQQLQLKDQKLQFEQSKLAIPPSPRQDNTSRPCSLCTEKEMHLRDMKEKIKRKMKLLSEREAQVIGKAHELRRREVQLLQLQNEVSETRKKNNASEAQNSDFTPAQANLRSHQTRKSRQDNKDEVTASREQKRKRKSEIDEQEQESKQPQHMQIKDEFLPVPITANTTVKSIRSSFDESIPTIKEEANRLSDGEDSSVETFQPEEKSDQKNDVPEGRDRRLDTKIDQEPHFKKGAARDAIRPMKVPSLNESVNRSNGIGIAISPNKRQCSLTKSNTKSSTKQRHIFTFEKKKQNEINRIQTLTIKRESSSRKSSSRGCTRDKWEGHDWIYSFDGQMKCAMGKLKELV